MKDYILSLCFAMLFCVAVNILVPGKKYEGIIKILCGIFLIATVINPLSDIFAVGEISMNTDKYFSNDSEYEFRINEGKDILTGILASGEPAVLEDVLSSLCGCRVTVYIRDGTIYVSGVPYEKRKLLADYAGEHGAEIAFED